ncbi:hypothetical protein SBA1_400044 [Candidatus Sulfotelmatobacter kueseliae]|uniref:Uncharacterized protein n=1 Tax=Candidatus Sulfotelmatobacter kueseliae TaxID=2042962 RepID=A0A2U3KQR5_9BACT|nr:hypothetical protein SBA1_400044 [Candidatus Sulfotelmatobacter kueseliae]
MPDTKKTDAPPEADNANALRSWTPRSPLTDSMSPPLSRNRDFRSRACFWVTGERSG